MNIKNLLGRFASWLANMSWVERLGWVGVLSIYFGYLFMVNGYMSSSGVTFLAMNIGGSALFGYQCYKTENPPGIFLQSAWILGSLPAVARLF